jgi:methylglutaconyl-CoA hydratase
MTQDISRLTSALTSPLLVEYKGGIAILTLNKPTINNAFDDEIIALLVMALDDCRLNDNVKIIQLRGAGRHFSAGADLNWMRRMAELDYNANREDAGQLARLMSTLYQINKPTIAVIQGASYGGAVGLIACCDFAIATEESSFCLSEVTIGLAPAVISPYVVKVMGERHARRYCISGEVINSQKAKDINLIHERLPSDKIENYVNKLSQKLLNNAPNAMGICKSLVQKISNEKLNDNIHHYTRDLIAQVRVSEEGQEGLSAFLEKRKPNWQSQFTDAKESSLKSNSDKSNNDKGVNHHE